MKINKIKSIVKKIFINHNLSPSHASISTDALINAELVGAYGHGLSRLKMYCDRIKKKVINSNLKLKLKKFHIQFLMWMQIIVLASLQQILELKLQ